MAQLQDIPSQSTAAVAALDLEPALDYRSEAYRDAYSRINAIVIEGEAEANHNYVQLAEMLPADADDLRKLAKMEFRHMKGFQACGRNLDVEADMPFAEQFFSKLHNNFQTSAAQSNIVSCLVIQALLIECFAIAAYNVYIPVADDFARRITEGVVKDEYMHLNYGQVWLKAHFDDPSVKEAIETANADNLPIVWEMFNQVTADADVLGMEADAILEDFMIAYGEALADIGFSSREVMKMAARGLKASTN